MGTLTEHFSLAEFACPCGQCETVVAPGLVQRLQRIRDAIRMPIKVTSGYRCAAYNKKIGGEVNSAHLTGEAADVAIHNNEFRFQFLEHGFRWFNRIGIYDKHCHLDISVALPVPRCWVDVSK